MANERIGQTLDEVKELLNIETTVNNNTREGGTTYELEGYNPSALEKSRITTGSNILLYGVPGAGKSWTIQHEYCSDESHIERIVFHPDYTYSDFVGQILPKVSDDGQVTYEFTPGPFTTLLKEAYFNPTEEYFLIIEEINRGNAPAIFGEVFQLLDRKVDDSIDDGFPIGTSEYGISNSDIARVVYNDPKRKIRIPSNMSIIGTMNTSDQNVFTLDTAFQRRWDMRLIENTFDNVDESFKNQVILDTDITWMVFCNTFNSLILENNIANRSSEDKRLGTYFVHLKDLVMDKTPITEATDSITRARIIRNNSRFPEKVLKYLWDDAFKFSREDVFDTSKYNSLEAIIKKFTSETGNARLEVFKQSVLDRLTQKDNEK